MATQLNYNVIARKNPSTKTLMYYAQKYNYSLITHAQLCQRIADNSQVPMSVVNAAAAAIYDSIVNFVSNGHSVQFGDLASIRPVVNCRGAATAAELSVKSNIKDIRIRAFWGNAIRSFQKPTNYNFVLGAPAEEP